MANKGKTLHLPTKLVDLAEQHFATNNASQAIRSCIEFSIMNCLSELQTDSNDIYHLLNLRERRDKKYYSVRIEDYAAEALTSITNKSISDAVITAMVLTLSFTEHPTTTKSLKLINILGSKWDERMQSAIGDVVSGKSWGKTYETCVGALGIHANFVLSDNELINDDDIEKINLYQCIQQYAFEFKAKTLLFDCTEAGFNSLKKCDYSNTPIPNVDRAVRFFIMNYFSTRNSGSTYINKRKKTLYAHLDVISPLSERLQNVKITNMDIFDVLHKHKREPNVLFIVDPIYLDANVYRSRTLGTVTEHGKEFRWEEHQRLAEVLRSIKGDFIYFCRITASRHKIQCNELLDAFETLRRRDIEMHGRIDDLYCDYHLYYMDIPLDNGTIERIITSFDFDGSTPYTFLTTEQEVAKYV